MAEEITQQLGFDASKAIQELGRLRGELNNFKQSLQSVSGALRKFPTNSMPAVKAFNQIAIAATTARIAIQNVGQVGTAPAAGIKTSAQEAASSMANLAAQTQTASQQVSSAVASSFRQAGQSMQQAGQAAGTAANAVQQGAAKTKQAAGQAAGALNNAGKSGQNAAKTITLSWKTVIRVVQAQIIVRAISAVVRAFTEAQVEARKFSLAVAEAFTISGGQLGSMDQLNQNVLDLSRNLGLAAGDVAEGVYQTLSNQVVDAGDALKFTNEAAKLSIATNSNLKESVNAISSVMNSYSLDISEQTRVADVLFKTIELGRLRLSEFGGVIGRVSPLTAALGIRYEEMSAAIAALTQKGVPAHTAITQLTQVSQKLLRPTEKLQELYRQWGVETGPEAIKRFGGLAAVLLKMKDASAGNDKEFSDLLGRVRSIVGALNLTSNGANALTKALDTMENSAGANEKAFEQMEDSVGRKATRAWENFGTTLIEAGQKLLTITTPIVETVDSLVRNIDKLRAAAIGAVAGLAGMRLATLTLSGGLAKAAITAATLRAAFLTLLPVLAATVAAFAAIKLQEWFEGSIDDLNVLEAEFSRTEEALTRKHNEETQKRIQAQRKESEARSKLTADFLTQAALQYRKELDLVTVSTKAVGRNLNNIIQDSLKKRSDAVKAIKEAILDTDNAIKTSADEVAKTQQSISDTAFERELRNLNTRQQIFAKIERAQTTASKAKKAYAEAGVDEEKVQTSRELSHLAEKRAEEAVNQAKRLGNYSTLKRAEDQLDKIRADRLRAEGTFQLNRKKFQTDAHKEYLKQKDEELAKLEELLKTVKELSEVDISKGSKQLAQNAERLKELAPILKDQLDKAFDFDIFDKLGVTDGLDAAKQSILDAFNSAKIDSNKILNEFQQKLNQRKLEAGVTIKIKNQYILEEFVKKFGEIDLFGDPSKFDERMRQVAEDTVNKYENLDTKIKNTAGDIADLMDEVDQFIKPKNFTNALDDIKKALARSKAKGPVSPEARTLIKQLEQGREIVKKAASEQRALTEGEKKFLEETGKAFDALAESGKISNKVWEAGKKTFAKLVELSAKLKELQTAINEQAKITPGAYEASANALRDYDKSAKDAKKAQEAATKEAGRTKDSLKKGSDAAKLVAPAAGTAKKALADETTQASKLRTELENAQTAQENISKAKAPTEAPTFAAPEVPKPAEVPITPEPPKISTAELQQQIEYVKQLNTELANVNLKFADISLGAKGLVAAFKEPLLSVESFRDSLVTGQQAVQNVSIAATNLPLQIGNSIFAVNDLISAVNSSITAIDSASLATGNWNQQLQNCVQSAGSVVVAMNNAAMAALNAAKACANAGTACAGGSVNANKGGYFFQSGGRGMDKIPAWLSAGEFVINSKSARDFFPQLQAINAGQNPVYRDQGGNVTTVGDIHVTVQGGDSSSQTIREIGTGLRRELRRKTIKLY